MESELISQLTNYIDKGGLIFLILILLSVISISIIFFKFFQFLLLEKKNFTKLENKIISSKNLNDFMSTKSDLNNPFNNIIYFAAQMLQNPNLEKSQKIAEIKISSEKEIKRLESYLPSLEIISQISPLVGLLGTVIGMISSFNQLEIGGSTVDPAILAGGIWTALLTTAAGLVVAIPALISHYFFEKKIENFQKELNQLLTLLDTHHTK